MDYGCWVADTASTPLRRTDQMPSAAGAVADTSSPAVPPLCEGDHHTVSHRHPVEGRQARRGQPLAHGVAKCRGCRGSHFT